MSGRQPISERFPTAPTPVTDRLGGAKKLPFRGCWCRTPPPTPAASPPPPSRSPPGPAPAPGSGLTARAAGRGRAGAAPGGGAAGALRRLPAAPRGKERARGCPPGPRGGVSGAERCAVPQAGAVRSPGTKIVGAPGWTRSLVPSPEKLPGDGASLVPRGCPPQSRRRRGGGGGVGGGGLNSSTSEPSPGGEPPTALRAAGMAAGGSVPAGEGLPRGSTPGEAAARMRAGPGWLPAGRSRPSPPTPTPLPLEFFHSAAPERVGGGRGRSLQNPRVSWQQRSSLRAKENFGRGCASGAELAGAVNHGLPFPSLPSPPLPLPLPSFLPPFPPCPEARTPAPARRGLAAP